LNSKIARDSWFPTILRDSLADDGRRSGCNPLVTTLDEDAESLYDDSTGMHDGAAQWSTTSSDGAPED
jgi:hypothetical protein